VGSEFVIIFRWKFSIEDSVVEDIVVLFFRLERRLGRYCVFVLIRFWVWFELRMLMVLCIILIFLISVLIGVWGIELLFRIV
jgi:hypothetical protein